MNVIFAPVMMAFHRFTDTFFDMRSEAASPTLDMIVERIDWEQFFSVVVAKTIPFFWIQAHTITFADGDIAWKSQTVIFGNRIDVSDLSPGDAVFFKIERLSSEAGDDLAGNVTVSSSWLEYKEWQNGANYK